jgi:tellurite resistance protein
MSEDDQKTTKTTERDRKISSVDELIQAVQARAIKNAETKDEKDDDPMNALMRLMMIMAMPKAIRSMGDDDGSSKMDMIVRQMQENQRISEERLLKEIENLKAEKKEKELLSQIDQKIEPIKNILDNISKEKEKQPDETTKSILSKIDLLQNQLKNLDEVQKAKAYKPIEDELSSLRMKLEELTLARSRGDPLDEMLQQMEKIEKTKLRLARMLGYSTQEAAEMSPSQLIDTITQKGPEILNSVRTMYDVMKGKEITDDNPVPAELPEVASPVTKPQMPRLAADLEQFLKEGHEEYIDPEDPSKGKAWVSKYGIPVQSSTGQYMNSEDIKRYALTYPDDLRNMAKQMEETWKEQEQEQQSKTPPPPPQPTETHKDKTENIPATEKPKEQEKKPQEPKEVQITDEMLDAVEKPAKTE